MNGVLTLEEVSDGKEEADTSWPKQEGPADYQGADQKIGADRGFVKTRVLGALLLVMGVAISVLNKKTKGGACIMKSIQIMGTSKNRLFRWQVLV